MIIKKSLLTYISFFIFIGCNANPQQSEKPSLTLAVSPSNIVIGQNAVLDVKVTNAHNLYGVSFEITFDKIIVEIDIEEGIMNYNQFSNGAFGPVIYSENGILSFVLGGTSIEGTIFSFGVKGLSAGSTSIELKKVNLIQEDGSDVPDYNSLVLNHTSIVIASD